MAYCSWPTRPPLWSIAVTISACDGIRQDSPLLNRGNRRTVSIWSCQVRLRCYGNPRMVASTPSPRLDQATFSAKKVAPTIGHGTPMSLRVRVSPASSSPQARPRPLPGEGWRPSMPCRRHQLILRVYRPLPALISRPMCGRSSRRLLPTARSAPSHRPCFPKASSRNCLRRSTLCGLCRGWRWKQNSC